MNKNSFLLDFFLSNKYTINRVFNNIIIYLIITNILLVIIDSFNLKNTKIINICNIIENISYIIFTVEYFIRCFHVLKIEKNIKKMLSFYMIIDLLSIIPFYLPLKIDLRTLRFLRLFKILKIGKYSKSLKILTEVLKETKNELFSCFMVIILIVFISSTFMFYIEHSTQPEAFPNIIATFWWAIATLTTVGYGDVYPITALGKVLTSFITLLSIGIVALPTGIISSGYINYIKNKK